MKIDEPHFFHLQVYIFGIKFEKEIDVEPKAIRTDIPTKQSCKRNLLEFRNSHKTRI